MVRRCARISRIAIALISTGIVSGGLAGCHNQAQNATDLHALAQPNDWVEVGKPTIIYDNEEMVISGHVHRKAGVTGDISGRMDIDVIDGKGATLAWIPALLTPDSLSSDPSQQSDYEVRFGYIPPAGSTVQVRFVDADTARMEDTDNVEYSNGKGGYGGHPDTAHPAATNAGRGNAPHKM